MPVAAYYCGNHPPECASSLLAAARNLEHTAETPLTKLSTNQHTSILANKRRRFTLTVCWLISRVLSRQGP